MKVKHFFIASITLLIGSIQAQAQLNLNGYFYGEDAFKYSQSTINGSARVQGLGGPYSSLGADVSNAYSNPAGLGFYNRSELSITPVFNSVNTSSVYINSNSKANNSNATIGQLGLVMNNSRKDYRKKSSNFAITYSKQNNLLTEFQYAGVNKKSSMANYFAEAATRRGANTEVLADEITSSSGDEATVSTSTAMYYQAYLINPVSGSGAPYTTYESGLPINQSGRNSSTGFQGQWNLAYGVNLNDKTYLGAAVGLVRVNYENLSNHKEIFPTGVELNGFNYSQDLYVRGGGINFSVGAIIKASENLNFGVQVNSPSWVNLTEFYNSQITIDPKPAFTSDYYKVISTDENEFSYKMKSPLKASGGVTLFLPNKKGFLTTDIEYVGYSQMTIKDKADNTWSNAQNKMIKGVYKDVVNLKAGAEYRIDNIRLRVGAKYMPEPYKQKTADLNRSQLLFTGGVGYRSSKFFVDLAGVFGQYKTAFTPYELANTSNFGSVENTINQKNFVISVGTFF